MSEHAQQEASSPVLYHASMSKKSFQSKLDDKSSSASSDSKKTKSSATGITSILSEQYSTTLISLLFKKPVPQWLLWMFHVHIIYGSLSVAFEKEFYFHYIGDLIISVQAIPRTLAADWYSYEALLFLCALLFVVQIITCIALYLSLSALQRGNNFSKITTNVVRISVCTLAFFNLIFIYWMTSFLACNDQSNMLRRFPLIPCWSQTNIVYTVIAIIFILLQIPLSIIGIFILFSSAGKCTKHPTIISMDSFVFISLLSVVNQVYLFISQFIPPGGVLARPILHIALSLVSILFLLYEFPFTFPKMNSLYSGILFAKCGGSIGAILAITINTSNTLELGLPFLLGAGLGSSLALFIMGFCVAELIYFVMKKRAKHARAQLDENIGKHVFNDNLLRLCFKSNLFSDDIDEDLLKYAMSRKSLLSTDALIASAIYTHKFQENPQLTLTTDTNFVREDTKASRKTSPSSENVLAVFCGKRGRL
nr:unnamed protein product [Naegleria fowleri]